ncbi:MAG: hypothetical protein DLM64_05565 [Solirubrobacterales bacterium]|nr:MAG: hypothetical protein DLM64_05565 [Solirubrobacterales bacterium]
MTDRIERELVVDATPERVWEVVTGPGWLADEVQIDLRSGGDASFRSAEWFKQGWVEAARAPGRLTFWWAAQGEPATRVELTLERQRDGTTRLRVVEARPLERLDLIGLPLPGSSGASLGPALVAA